MHEAVLRFPAAIVLAGFTIASPLLDAQTVIATIGTISEPAGTLSSPYYVIDSDGPATAPEYDRDKIPVTVTASFKLPKGSSSGGEKFRVTVQIIDDAGATVSLSGGTSTSQIVSLNLLSPTATRVFSLNLDPTGDLGAGRDYFLRARIQWEEPPVIIGGRPRWVTTDGPNDTGTFTVVHFTSTTSSDAAVNVRGYPTGAPTWTRRSAMVTDPDKNEFVLELPYRLMRYDIGDGWGANLIGIEVDVDLTDDTGAPVALANDGKSTRSLSMYRFNLAIIGNPVTPTAYTGQFAAPFRPADGVVLDSVNRRYRATVTLRHLEVPPDTLWEDAPPAEGSLTQLLHFSGSLHWDAVVTTVGSISNEPGVVSNTASYVNSTLMIDGNAGTINNRPDLQFGTDTLLNVRLFPDGHAEVSSGQEAVTVAATGGRLTAGFGNVTVEYVKTTLSSTGPYVTEVHVQLPQGLGYTSDISASRNRFEHVLEFQGATPLDPDFRHTDNLSRSLPAGAGAFDEARPLVYEVTNARFFTSGRVEFGTSGPGGVEYSHTAAFNQLAADAANGYHDEPAMADRSTNDGYLRFVDLEPGASLSFDTVSDGSARLQGAPMSVQPGAFTAHFPAGAPINWQAGQLSHRDGSLEAGSRLVGVAPVALPFDGSCADDDCADGASTETSLSLVPDGDVLLFSKDGGLHAGGKLPPSSLQWGLRGDGAGNVVSYAHRTGAFEDGWFQMAGQHGYAAENPALAPTSPWKALGADLAPATVLFAGYDPGNHDQPVYPGSPAYLDGQGFYAGHNFVSTTGLDGASRLGGATKDYNYTLRDGVSKYYVRRGGLSGRHVPLEGSYASEMIVYDYFFEVERFQLSFLSNRNKLSWFDGAVHVPEPSGFSQRFTGLTLTCTGELSRPEIDPKDRGTKALSYWNGEFKPVALEFAEIAGTGPCYPDRALVIGLTSEVAHVPGTLSGKLAFMNDGNIGTPQDGVTGADGRLGLPATIPLDGPAGERWSLVPTTRLYFNNPDHAAGATPGFVTFAGTMNVPYFEDVEVQMLTSANGLSTATVHLTGGWEAGSETYFTDSNFDPDHRGYPSGMVPLGTYKDLPTGDAYTRDSDAYAAYRVTARQSLFGLVPLSYPLKWSITGRYFKSAYPMEESVVVLEEAMHQVDYMSPANLEVSFGAKYEGLPEINLASAVYSAVDEQLGASEALTRAATSFVTDTLEDGVEEMGKLVGDTLEELLDEAVNAIDEEVLVPLYDAVAQSYTAARNNHDSYNDWVVGAGADLQAEFDRYLDGTLGGASATLRGRLDELADATDSAASLVNRIEGALDRGILAIDSVAGELQTVLDDTLGEVVKLEIEEGDRLGQTINGILAKVDVGGGSHERQVVQALVDSLVRELAGPDIAAAVGDLYNEATGEVNSQLGALLDEIDPTLDRVVEALLEARAFLDDIKTELQGTGELIASFQELVANAGAEFDSIVADVRTTAHTFLANLVATAQIDLDQPLDEFGNLLDEFSREEFVALLRAELRDLLLESAVIEQIQYVLRQWIYDLDMVLHSAVDSAFGEVRRLTELVIQEALGPIDDAINGLLGDIGEYLGSGEIDGYAHIEGDSLKRLRIDGKFQFKIPDDMELNAYLEMLAYDSGDDFGSSACLEPGDEVLEVKIGATDVGVDWISPDLRADLEVKVSMMTAPSLAPRGVGGSFEMTGGSLEFEAFEITEFAAAVGVSIGASEDDKECFIAASARMEFSSYEVEGGIFFGRTCSLAPIEMINSDVAALLGTPPFTGAYVYGEVWLPISEMLTGIPASCLFRISAGVGAGAFYFVEGPTWGGQMLLGVSGEALCVVSIKGELRMIGVMSGNELRYSGRGTLKGKAGACPFCIKFNKSAKFEYQNGDWSVDY